MSHHLVSPMYLLLEQYKMKNELMVKLKTFTLNTLAATSGIALTTPLWATTAQVPEPNIITLLGIGVVSAILIARYRARK